MGNTTIKRNIERNHSPKREGCSRLPLVTRRFAAWTVEVSLIVTSGLVPFGIGMHAKSQPVEEIPLNPVLAVTTEAIAKTLALPVDDSNSKVPPVTNFFWSAALALPLVLTSWQLLLLAKTGSTLPKRWFGVRVVTIAGTSPGLSRVLLREGLGCWGLPLLGAYLLWRYTIAFPSLSALAGLSCLMVLGEGISARFHRQRRCLHDLLADTYVVDAHRAFKLAGHLNLPNRVLPPQKGNKIPPRSRSGSSSNRYAAPDRDMSPLDTDTLVREFEFVRPDLYQSKLAANLTAVQRREMKTAVSSYNPVSPKPHRQKRSLWSWLRKHPNLTLLMVTLSGMAAVLGTLVSTQVYIQEQIFQRQLERNKSEQFLTLVKQLNPNVATLDERQRAILALGTLNEPQALKLLVDLLGQQTNKELDNAIQQALVSNGPQALPYLQRLNHSLVNKLGLLRYTALQQQQSLHTQRLISTQQAIANILSIYSSNAHTFDLSRTDLGKTSTDSTTFTLALDDLDLSGIHLKGANLNQASFRGSRFRGVGADGRWDTSDDWITDLSEAQIREANLNNADLSRTLMNRTNLIRATLSHANLSRAHLNGANLSSTQMVGANLSESELSHSSLTGANLGEANLSQANLYAAMLGRVSAIGTQLQDSNLNQSDWREADLSGANLSRANLSHANLSATKLTGATFRNAVMRKVNLRNADLTQVDLRGANLAGADLQGAIFTKSEQAPLLTKSNQLNEASASRSKSALVESVDFSEVKNLNAQQIAYICVQGGRHPRCP